MLDGTTRTKGKETKTMITYETCPACSSKAINRNFEILGLSGRGYRVSACTACRAIFSKTLYLGDSYDIVAPYFISAELDTRELETRYFDFLTLGSKGMTRRHGWFDPITRLITQVG
jgi:hypothetical protein